MNTHTHTHTRTHTHARAHTHTHTHTHRYGCHIYVGLIRPGGNLLEYTAASRYSAMSGQKLARGQGVSWSAVDQRTPIVVNHPEAYGAEAPALGAKVRVDVKYGRRWYPAVCVCVCVSR